LFKQNKIKEKMADLDEMNALLSKTRDLLEACEKGDMSKLEEGVACADKLLRVNPHQVNSLIMKGLALSAAKKSQEAILCYNHVIKSFPTNYLGYFNKGCEMFILEKFEEAHVLFVKSIDLEPDHSSIYVNKGDCLYALEKYDEALKAFTKSAQLDDQNFKALKNQANCFRELKNYKRAVQSYTAALKLQSNDFNCHFQLAEICRSYLQDFAQANIHYDKLIEMRPDNRWFYIYKGDCLFKLLQWQKLIDTYEAADKIESTDSDLVVTFARAFAYYCLEVAARRSSKDKKDASVSTNGQAALKYINMCLKLDPDYLEGYDLKRDILLCLNRNEEAAECEMAELEVRLRTNRL
jgi:tetratricopeptide (TPR) repeat protein